MFWVAATIYVGIIVGVPIMLFVAAIFSIISEEKEMKERKKKGRPDKGRPTNQYKEDYSRVMTENQAAELYLTGPQLLPYASWKNLKNIETYEEVYRV